jgi:uncharacterized coiled-coil DUF342 family protein
MNTRPTPETDKFFATFADGEATPSHAEYYVRLQDLERERDEAREQLAEIEDKMRIELRGYHDSKLWGEAGLIAATMRCVDALDVVTEQRDRLAEEVGQLKSRLTQTMGAVTISRNGYVQELEQQRDRLAEALETITITGSAQYCREIADEALQSLTQKP